MTIKNSKFLHFTLSFFILIFAFYICFPVHADEAADAAAEAHIAELRAKIEELTKQAEQYRGTVLQKHQEADTLKRQVDILNNQILALQSQIGATENSISETKLEITTLAGELFQTQKNIDLQKTAIAEAMTALNEHDHVDMLAALLQNPNLSDFVNQEQQVSNWNTKLNSLLMSLKNEKLLLEQQQADLEKKRAGLEQLNQRQVAQKGSLATSKTSKNKLLVDTKGQEAQYQKMLNETEKQEAAFFAELQTLEHNAVVNGTIITHVTATAVPPRGTKIFQMPYPAGDFRITQGYGMTTYARRTRIYGGQGHSGVDIVSGFGSEIHPIGTGVVLASGFNNGFGNWVAVKHYAGGGMVSIYGHMQSGTIVRIGTAVTTDSVLGYEGSTGSSTGSHVHLSIYKDFFTYINPKNNQLYFNYIDGTVNPLDYLQ